MPSRTAPPCTHEQRPGTTVCLYCRQAERAASLARAKRAALMVTLGGAAVAAVVAWGLRDRGEGDPIARVTTKVRPLADTAVTPVTPPATAPAAVDVPVNAARSAAPPASQQGRQARLAPVIAQGTTELGGGIVAVRTGDTVAVRFDHPLTRTRRPDKFEQIVRSTVGDIYGAGADSLVRALPEGTVARAGDLVNDLPTRGVRLALAGGDTLTVWPTVRRGRDGMLVVAYRAVVR